MARLRPDQLELVFEALCASFWYKRGLEKLLRQCAVSQNDLSHLSELSKRKFLEWLFERYEQSDRGHEHIRTIARALIAKRVFPDLDATSTTEARGLIEAMRMALEEATPSTATKHDPEIILTQADSVASVRSTALANLRTELEQLYDQIGTQDGGYAFERLFISIARASGLECRDPYFGNGRQFDGSVLVDSHTYLLESRFQTRKAESGDISNLRDKVQGNADLTQGLFVSMGGYTSGAVKIASRAGSPVILLDSTHVLAALNPTFPLGEIIRLSKRRAAEESLALSPMDAWFPTTS